MNPYASVCANQMYVPSVVWLFVTFRVVLSITHEQVQSLWAEFQKGVSCRTRCQPGLLCGEGISRATERMASVSPGSAAAAGSGPVQPGRSSTAGRNKVRLLRCHGADVHSALTIEMAVLANQGQQAVECLH